MQGQKEKNWLSRYKVLIIVGVLILLAVGGGGYYFKNHSSSSGRTTSSSAKSIDLSAAMAQAKTKFPTVTATKVYTEETDPNNLLGKPNQYVAGAAFLDSRTDTTGDDWGADGGGGIEVFANAKDAEKRAEYFTGLQQSGGGALTDPGAFKQQGIYVIRASSALTKSQQDEVITYLQTLVQ